MPLILMWQLYRRERKGSRDEGCRGSQRNSNTAVGCVIPEKFRRNLLIEKEIKGMKLSQQDVEHIIADVVKHGL
ncbi:MAG: hypothetical protein QW115_03025, partial [Thermoplasmata archaeon]